MNEELRLATSTLSQSIDEFLKDVVWKKKLFKFYSIGLTLLAIAISLAITISGIYDKGTITAVLGASLAALLAVHRAFPIDKISRFYRSAATAAENMFSPLPSMPDMATCNAVRGELKTLRQFVADGLPQNDTDYRAIALQQQSQAPQIAPVPAPVGAVV